MRDSDVEEYLKGLLWVLQMYTDGVCPDVSFTYMSRPPVSPFLVKNYISKLVWKNCLLAGIKEVDFDSSVRYLFRSLRKQTLTTPLTSFNSNCTNMSENQFKKLESMFLDNKIGVDVGGVSWQEIKSKVYVPISSWR